MPIFGTVCLLSSSFFIWLAEHAIDHGKMAAFRLWWGVTFLLGAIFLGTPASEWHKLIVHDHLTDQHESVRHDLLLAGGAACDRTW